LALNNQDPIIKKKKEKRKPSSVFQVEALYIKDFLAQAKEKLLSLTWDY
jgi:hypothetical protein